MSDTKTMAAVCVPENLRYSELLYTSYGIKNPADETQTMDIRHYILPLPKEKEERLIMIDPSLARKTRQNEFYATIGQGVSRDYKISKYLEDKKVRSTVRYNTYGNENGQLYLATEKLTPLSEVGFFLPNPVTDKESMFTERKPITAGFVVDMARRLFAICQDMDAAGVTHRNINPHCIFFDSQNRLHLGGFDCAMNRNQDDAPVINPTVFTAHVAPDVKRGEAGSLVSDMYSIASLMCSFFGGVNICEDTNGTIPENLPALLQDTIALGLSMKASNLLAFRKALNEIWKHGRMLWDWNISAFYQLQLGAGSGTPTAASSSVETEKKHKFKRPQKAEQAEPVKTEKKSADKLKKLKKEKQPKSTARAIENTGPDKLGKAISFAMGVITMTIVVALVLLFYGVIPSPF